MRRASTYAARCASISVRRMSASLLRRRSARSTYTRKAACTTTSRPYKPANTSLVDGNGIHSARPSRLSPQQKHHGSVTAAPSVSAMARHWLAVGRYHLQRARAAEMSASRGEG